ncbi:hypothetical protein [Sulfobacillus thermosulfidooxidans]|uniref:hypothetical protein n=1 Tax=Sulfobacillus thermosulfidooxidans TaxID=28034 RepID=UPI0006B47DBC|nr:hypothetical protein [Sulfobacillus thermosulfidooxidans]
MTIRTTLFVAIIGVTIAFALWIFFVRQRYASWPIWGAWAVLPLIAVVSLLWPTKQTGAKIPWAWHTLASSNHFSIALRNQTGETAYHVYLVVAGNEHTLQIAIPGEIMNAAEVEHEVIGPSITNLSRIMIEWRSKPNGRIHRFEQRYRAR